MQENDLEGQAAICCSEVYARESAIYMGGVSFFTLHNSIKFDISQ